jgi:hypothetical protein
MKRKILFVMILLVNYFMSYSQWIQTDGPYGNSNVLTVFEHDSNFFASTYLSGFFSKSVVENSWDLNSNIYFKTFTIKGDSLFADAHYFSGGTSRDLGIQLFDLNNPEVSPSSINSTITSQALKHSDTCLYGGNKSKGFFKLSFDGTFLEYYNNGLPTDTIWTTWGTYYETDVTAIELFDDFIFCGTDKGVYRNDANLGLWHEVNNGLLIGNVTFIEEISDTLYTSIEENLYYSADEGNNWELLFTAPSKITSFQKEGIMMLVSTSNNGIYNSIDNGINWDSMNIGLTDLSVNFIFKRDSIIFCGTTTKGVFIYHKRTWLDNNLGMVSSLIKNMTCTNNNLVAIEDKSIYLKSDNNYKDITPNIINDNFLNIDNMGDTIFVSNYYIQSNWPYFNQFFHYTYDNGTTWTEIGNLPYTSPGGNSSHNIHIENTRIYASSEEKMFYSDDLCLNWTDISLPSQYCNSFNDFEVYNSQPFATACGNGQLVKLDNTNNWILSNNGLPSDREPLDIAYCDSAVFTYVLVHGMYVSFDNGDNWTYASNGLNTGDFGIRDFANYGRHLFVSTENGVFVTSNYGQNWYECNDGLKNLNTSALKILQDTLYVGTYGNGIWKRAIDNISLSIADHQNSALDFKIYPNPATDAFRITGITDKSQLQFFDIEGKLLFTKDINRDEYVSVSSLPQGIYIVRIKTDAEIWEKKLLKD